ncbi:DUF3189 family protein [Phosphitispora sp. TUW77]|uniref:DUF3189 family protein n=1 Tax=Phosphitispora sp. TUW77 TaxID=3152361 RepID=UPI003AB6F41E
MKVFFICRSGHHTSVIAAFLYLGKLTGSKINNKDIFSLPGFDETDFRDTGRPFFAGTNDVGTEVYTIGALSFGSLLKKAAGEMIKLFNDNTNTAEWQVIDVSLYTSRWTVWGLRIKKLHLRALAKAFFYLGARRETIRLAGFLEKNMIRQA